MSKLTITGNVKVKADKVDFVKEELLKLIPITRAEEGCMQYDLHQDNEDPTYFMFFENWESKELLEKHANSQHLKDFVKSTEGCIDKFWINEMTHIA